MRGLLKKPCRPERRVFSTGRPTTIARAVGCHPAAEATRVSYPASPLPSRVCRTACCRRCRTLTWRRVPTASMASSIAAGHGAGRRRSPAIDLAVAARSRAGAVATHPQPGRGSDGGRHPDASAGGAARHRRDLGPRPPSIPSWATPATRPSLTCRFPSAWRSYVIRRCGPACWPKERSRRGRWLVAAARRHPAFDDRPHRLPHLSAGAEAAVPNYEPTMADSVGAAARARGVPVMEALLDARWLMKAARSCTSPSTTTASSA